MKITIVAGARPNFMKIAPITRAIEAARALGKSISYRLVYTGRKDDTSLDASLFSDLDMKAPDVYLGVESSNPTSLTAGIMVAFEQELTENPAHVVLVVDDLTATMSCAIVAKKQGIKVAHLVAGTRSFDMKMPKEVNRMITDGLSDYLFTAGMVANRNLNQTGTESENVYYVGNILIDAIRYNRNRLLKPIPRCGVLDVVQRAAGNVHQVCRGDPGGPFPGKKRGRGLGWRSYVLHQKRPGGKVAFPCLHLCGAGCPDGLRHRQCHPGERHHYCRGYGGHQFPCHAGGGAGPAESHRRHWHCFAGGPGAGGRLEADRRRGGKAGALHGAHLCGHGPWGDPAEPEPGPGSAGLYSEGGVYPLCRHRRRSGQLFPVCEKGCVPGHFLQ